jgi:hypothetical protein
VPAKRAKAKEHAVDHSLAAGSSLLVPVACPSNRDTLLAINPGGARLAVAAERADFVQVFDTRSGEEATCCAGFGNVTGLEFLSAEVLLVTAVQGCFRCDLRRNDRERLLSEDGLTRTALSPNGRVLAIGARSGLILYDLRRRQVLRRLKVSFAYSQRGNRAAFSADGRYVAAELREDDREGPFVVVWDARDGRRLRVFDPMIHALAFREDTLALAVADDCGQVLVYEPDRGEEPATRFKIPQASSGVVAAALQFRDAGRTLGVLMSDGAFAEVEAAKGRALRRQPPPPGPALRDVAPSADWSVFAGATEAGVVVWPGDRASRPRARPAAPKKAK